MSKKETKEKKAKVVKEKETIIDTRKRIQPERKKNYEKQEYDLIGVVIERKKWKAYRHNNDCVREETNVEPFYKWTCVGPDNGCKYGSLNYTIYIECENRPEIKEIDVYEDKIKAYGKEKDWKLVEDKGYIDKRFLFVCHKYDKDYKLIRLVELPKK